MKTKNLILVAAFCSFSSQIPSAPALGTAFTYQGRLNTGASPAMGIYDLHFTIYDSASGPGGLVAGPLTNSATGVSNGLFTVVLDFGIKVFTGEDRWLEIGVRTNGGGTFTNLSPRQPITPAPYAITAANLSSQLPFDQLAGTLQSGQLSGIYSGAVTFSSAGNSFTGNGSGLTNLNASRLTSGTVPDTRLSTNVALLNASATFFGTVQALGDLKGLRLNIGTGHVLTGSGNSVAGGDQNTNRADYSTIGGGLGSDIQPGALGSFIGGGFNNIVRTNSGGGTIGGGEQNVINEESLHATIAGGVVNSIGADSDRSAIGGGDNNTIAGGSPWATIAGGFLNNIGTNADRSTIGGGHFNHIAGNAAYSTIAGGIYNDIGVDSYGNAIGGGEDNNIAGTTFYAVIAGGVQHGIGTNSDSSTIGGGEGNSIENNSAYATIGGGGANSVSTDSQFSTVAGGEHNTIKGNSPHATIAGGHLNLINFFSDRSTVGGGENNLIGLGSSYVTIAGGIANDVGVNSAGSVVGGGEANNIADNSTLGVIAGGNGNKIGANSAYAAIGGGQSNSIAASGSFGVIPGGASNIAATRAFAAGSNARATNQGAFVWSDSTGTTTGSTNNNSVTMRASGGYRFFTGTGTAGAQLTAGATAWSVLSDRNMKKDIRPADSLAILDQLSRVPMSRWHYTWESESDPLNLGPMAQDFKAVFYPGRDDKTISTLEFDGVALAAIQGLNEKVESGKQKAEIRIEKLEAKLAQKETEVMELRRRLEALEGFARKQSELKEARP